MHVHRVGPRAADLGTVSEGRDEDEEHEVPQNQCDNRIVVAGNFYSN